MDTNGIRMFAEAFCNNYMETSGGLLDPVKVANWWTTELSKTMEAVSSFRSTALTDTEAETASTQLWGKFMCAVDNDEFDMDMPELFKNEVTK